MKLPKRAVIAALPLALCGCLEVNQHPAWLNGGYAGKIDQLPYQQHFHRDRLAWSAAVTNRNLFQNEYVRAKPPGIATAKPLQGAGAMPPQNAGPARPGAAAPAAMPPAAGAPAMPPAAGAATMPPAAGAATMPPAGTAQPEPGAASPAAAGAARRPATR